MVNLQIGFGAAVLASVVVPCASSLTLLVPIWAAVFRVPAFPRRIVWAGHVIGFALPFKSASWIAEIMCANPTWLPCQQLAASVTRDSHRGNVLYMAFSSWANLLT